MLVYGAFPQSQTELGGVDSRPTAQSDGRVDSTPRVDARSIFTQSRTRVA